MSTTATSVPAVPQSLPPEQEQLESIIKDLLRFKAVSWVQVGKQLAVLKKMVKHGKWNLALERIGIPKSVAPKLVSVGGRFLQKGYAGQLLHLEYNQEALINLDGLSDDQIMRLDRGESVEGWTVSDIAGKKVREIRDWARKISPAKASKNSSLDNAEQKAEGETPPLPADHPALTVPLSPFDLVKSLYASRAGRVAKVYADGSACVAWDDGEPQPEGMGHERMPRSLLVYAGSATPDGMGWSLEDVAGRPLTAVECAAVFLQVRDEDPDAFPADGAPKNGATVSSPAEGAPSGVMQKAFAARREYQLGKLRGFGNLAAAVRDDDALLALDTCLTQMDLKALDLGHPVKGLDLGNVGRLTAAEILERFDAAPAPGGNTGPALPPATAPMFTATADARHELASGIHFEERPAEDPTQYPAVYALLPGEFQGASLSLLVHEGRPWLIAEEIAAVLGDTAEAIAELEDNIGKFFDLNFPASHYAKVRLASTVLVVRLLDQRAVAFLCDSLATDTARAFADWFNDQEAPSTAAPAGPVPLSVKPAAPGPTGETLEDLLTALHEYQNAEYRAVHNAASLLKSMVFQAFNASKPGEAEVYLLGDLAEVASQVLAPVEGLQEDQENCVRHIKHRLLQQPGTEDRMPDSVWFNLVSALTKDMDALATDNDMWRLTQQASSLYAYAARSPEASGALMHLHEFMQRRGAYLYEAEGRERLAYAWHPGQSPKERQQAGLRAVTA